MHIPLVNLPLEHSSYQSELDASIHHVISSGRYIGGDEVLAFEKDLANYLGLEPWSVISCANGSDALLLSLSALDLPKGSEVIIATHNYVAAAEAVWHLGLSPIWADVVPPAEGDSTVSYQINGSLDYLESLYTPLTRVLIAVNMYGQPCPAESITTFCQRHKIPWIEDNAQGLGGVGEITKGVFVPLGTRATIGTTSFFPTKPLGCMGDGGAIFIPQDKQLAERLRQLANHGQSTRYRYEYCGYNSRLDALQATILRVKLRHLDEANRQRRLWANRYDKLLSDIPSVRRPLRHKGYAEALYLYTICVPRERRDGLLDLLRSRGVDARIYYPQMLHHIAIYNKESMPHRYPVADNLQYTMLSLPIAPTTTSDQIDEICQVIQHYLT